MSVRSMLTTRATQVRRLARLRPFDTSTESGRSLERYRRIAHTAAAQIAARGLSMTVSLLTVPLTANYLGKDRYGLWATIASFTAMLAFADLGLGNGLLTAISEAHGKNDSAGARRMISSAGAMLLGMGMLIAATFALAYPFIRFDELFNIKDPLAAAEAGPAMIALVACFALSIPLGLVQKVQLGYQEGVASSAWTMLGNALQIGALLLVILLRGGLPWLVLAMVGAPVLATVINGVVIFGGRHRDLLPRVSDVHRGTVIVLLRSGWMFMVLHVVSAMVFASDNFVISRVLGLDAVADYNVPMRLFALVTVVVGAALQPLWPAYGEAASRGDVGWVFRTLRRSLVLAATLSLGASLALVIFGPWLIDLWMQMGRWLHGSTADPVVVHPTFALLAGMGAWSVLYALGAAVAMFLNGCGKVRPQVYSAIALGIVGLGLKLALVRPFGGTGVIWATVISYTACTAIPIGIVVARTLREVSKSASAVRPHPGTTPDETALDVQNTAA